MTKDEFLKMVDTLIDELNKELEIKKIKLNILGELLLMEKNSKKRNTNKILFDQKLMH